MEVAERRLRMREEAIARARRYVEEAASRLGPLTAILVGSYARGDFNRWSDVDVLIVSPRLPENPLRRLDLLQDPRHPEIEPIPITPREYRRQLSLGTPLIREAMEKGVVLRDDLRLVSRR